MSFSKALQRSLLLMPLLPLFLSACAASSSKLSPTLPNAASCELEKPVARVNGSYITRADLDRAKKIIMANKPALVIPPLLQREFELQALNQLIGSELLFQASRKLDIKDLDQQAQEKVAQIKRRFPEPRDFERELKKIGEDEQGLLESTRRDLAIAYLVNTRIAPEIEVSEAEIEKFYEGNPEKFRQPERVRASHILIGVDGKAGIEERKAARAKADRVRQELLKGADFAKIARENSTCPSGKQGGELGYFGRGEMEPQFEKAAFALPPGGLSEVVETRYGYHIIRLSERSSAGEIPLAAARERIRNYLRAQKVDAASEAFVGEARKNAKIELFL